MQLFEPLFTRNGDLTYFATAVSYVNSLGLASGALIPIKLLQNTEKVTRCYNR